MTPLPRGAAIRRAATIAGGVRPLARLLQVDEHELEYWMRDIGRPPDTVFFDVLNVIIESAGMIRAPVRESEPSVLGAASPRA